MVKGCLGGSSTGLQEFSARFCAPLGLWTLGVNSLGLRIQGPYGAREEYKVRQVFSRGLLGIRDARNCSLHSEGRGLQGPVLVRVCNGHNEQGEEGALVLFPQAR